MCKRSNIIIIITCSFVIVFIAFIHLYLSVIRTWSATLPRDDFPKQILLIFTQLNLTIDQLRIIRQKRKHAFLYHCLLLCDCSRALIRAQEYISLVFSQKSKMCWISTIWRKMCWISFFLEKSETLNYFQKTPSFFCASLKKE